MKKFVIYAMNLLLVIALLGCGTKTPESESDIEYEIDNSINVEKLMEQYPEYFELSDFKGIEVYVWQMAEESYRCGIMSGTNRNKTEEEIWKLQEKSLSVDEAKALLNELEIDRNNIIVIPTAQPYSSYLYEIDNEYTERVKKLFEY